MPHTRNHVPALTLAAFFTLSASGALGEVPSWIASDHTVETGRPLWVTAEEAAPNGFLRWELFEPHQRGVFRRNLARSAEARSKISSAIEDRHCLIQMITSYDASHSWSSEELLERSAVVYSGQIEDVEPGFLNGNLGTLIDVSVRKTLKEPSAGPARTRFLVFIPNAEVLLEGEYLCSRGVREPAVPKQGGILILASRQSQPQWLQEGIFVAEESGLFFESDSGALSTPHAYGMIELTAQELEQSLQKARKEAAQ